MSDDAPRRPLTDKEQVIANLVASCSTVTVVHQELAKGGYYLAKSTLRTRIRDIAAKLPNPFGLGPVATIKSWVGKQDAA